MIFLGPSREKERGIQKVPVGQAESELDVVDQSGLFQLQGIQTNVKNGLNHTWKTDSFH